MSGEAAHQSGFGTVARRDAETAPPSIGSLEARASLALKVMTGINLAGVVMAMVSPLVPVSNLLTLSFSGAAAVLAVLYLIEARALDRRRPWAVTAVRPLLILLIVSGASAVLIALSGGAGRVPFDGLLAAWAWLGAPDRSLIAGRARRAAALVGAACALLVGMVLAKPLFGWGGLADVHEPDLAGSIHVDCGAPGAAMPTTISLSYDWSWRSTSLLPNAFDMVVFGWSGADPQGRPLFVLDKIPEPAPGIRLGVTGDPSTELANEVGAESEGSFRFAIDLEKRGFEPGTIRLPLMRPREDPPGPNSVTFVATYVHLGLWRSSSTTTCTW